MILPQVEDRIRCQLLPALQAAEGIQMGPNALVLPLEFFLELYRHLFPPAFFCVSGSFILW